ncbi:NfeD family protein [Paraglaciecola aquimarina]|uniref:NfeD family protein n=1 Tax=Paraglaciecola algarum TaxID=3050085 RepID=A0ABS9D5P6_9ALTE|nr:NfeD family protein [Paraglaciecola sp. G1-23]MCF2947347.1 NfeD family protein [Paraglaciecola sp. G1-23]
MDWAYNNLAESLLILGILLLVIEILVLGFSTFVLFFVGLAAIVTSAFLFIEIIPNTLLSACLSTGIITALLATVLWKPLKNSQNKVDKTKAKSDLIGHSFVLTEDVSPEYSPSYRYSGIEWKLESANPISVGTSVVVIDVSVGKFTIEAKI